MTENEAYARIVSMVQANEDPALTEAEIRTLVARAKRPDAADNPPTNVATVDTWSASTGYVYGDVVTADPAAGRFWMCTNASTSGATQPEWPDLDGKPPKSYTVIDDDLTWLDVGTLWQPTFDLNFAAAEGWRLKSGKVATRYDFTTDGQTFRRGQMLSMCHRMQREYRRLIARGI